jgi:hypothetical protein
MTPARIIELETTLEMASEALRELRRTTVARSVATGDDAKLVTVGQRELAQKLSSYLVHALQLAAKEG